MMYVVLGATWGVIRLITGFRNKLFTKVILIFALLATFLNIANYFIHFTQHPFLKLFTIFFTGSVFYIFREKIFLSNKLFIFAVLLLSVSIINKSFFFLAYSVFSAYIVFYLAYVPSGTVRRYNSFGDYSYGMYIYAFPIQQSIASIFPEISVLNMIMLSGGITLAFSCASWHVIEKKFLQFKNDCAIFSENLKVLATDWFKYKFFI